MSDVNEMIQQEQIIKDRLALRLVEIQAELPALNSKFKTNKRLSSEEYKTICTRQAACKDRMERMLTSISDRLDVLFEGMTDSPPSDEEIEKMEAQE